MLKIFFKKYPFHILFGAMYLAGLIGMNSKEVQPFFLFFTPIHLLATCCVLIWFHEDRSRSFWIFTLSAFLIGYGIEIVGVNTGLIFGEYTYNTTLGFKLLNTPPMIGGLWFQLSYCFGMLLQQTKLPLSLKILAGAAAMTLLDYVVEPVAIRFAMWSWGSSLPPMQNYIGWFVVSIFIFMLFFMLPFKKTNKISNWILLLTCLFFLGHRLVG